MPCKEAAMGSLQLGASEVRGPGRWVQGMANAGSLGGEFLDAELGPSLLWLGDPWYP